MLICDSLVLDALADLITGITTIADFRVADVAAGGESILTQCDRI